jgi:hypothetical protein
MRKVNARGPASGVVLPGSNWELDSSMSWQTWTLSEWNKALVAAVFFDSKRLAQCVTRIQASDKFLAGCTGDPSCLPGAAARAFIACFGSTSAEVGSHFIWHDTIVKRTAQNGFPGVFAALYLTLLAASADAETHDEGNFRNRFVELLKQPTVRSPNLAGLPLLWKHVERWSVSRAKKYGDCRVLVLPHPGREILIGHSKRLAFPAYSDEVKLQKLLCESGLGSNSEFRSVAWAVSRRENLFSLPFREEFKLFLKLVAGSRFQAAYDSPFWGAIQAITWDAEQAGSKKAGIFHLGADVSDPSYPEFYLLTDETGRGNLGTTVAFRALGVLANNMFAAQPLNEEPWTPQRLLAAAASRPRLAQAKLWQSLNAGCAALFTNAQGSVTSEGEHFDGGPACLVVQGRLGAELIATARTLGLKHTDAKAGGLFGTWKVLLFDSLSSQSLSRLAETLPPAARAGIPAGWRPQRITHSGGAWFGQSLLLNPASIPLFQLRGASSGSYELADSEGSVIAAGALEEIDGRFTIAPAALAEPVAALSLRVRLAGPQKTEGHLTLTLAEQIPMGPPACLPDPRLWLADGRDGTLSEAGVNSGTAALPVAPVQLRGEVQARMTRFEKIGSDPLGHALRAEINEMPSLLSWVAEALCLRLQRRPTLPFTELYSHLTPACSAAAAQRWLVKRLLFSAGWLMQLEKRTSSFAIAAPAPRTIALYTGGGPCAARIVGMFSKSELACLSASLRAREVAVRLVCSGAPLGIGAIELQLSAPQRILELAEQFGLHVLEKSGAAPPLAIPRQFSEQTLASSTTVSRTAETEAWNQIKHSWVPAAAASGPLEPGAILRFRGVQRWTYWVAAHGILQKTDSAMWAFMLSLAAAGKPVGQIAVNGDCQFHEQVPGIPLPMVRWWMHWGGGYVGILPSGSIYLGGGASSGIWEEISSWLPRPPTGQPPKCGHLAALARRQLALRLRSSHRVQDIRGAAT